MDNEKDRLKKIIEQEGQRLDNQTVFGGFHQFIKIMIQKLHLSVPEDLLSILDNYPQLSKTAKSDFLKNLAICIFDNHQYRILPPHPRFRRH